MRWSKDVGSKKVWRSNTGQIITNESFTCGGIKCKFYAVYANNAEREKGNNYASGENLAQAKSLALATVN